MDPSEAYHETAAAAASSRGSSPESAGNGVLWRGPASVVAPPPGDCSTPTSYVACVLNRPASLAPVCSRHHRRWLGAHPSGAARKAIVPVADTGSPLQRVDATRARCCDHRGLLLPAITRVATTSPPAG